MGRSKDKNEYENLKGIIREQKAIIRNLRKEVQRLSKQHNRTEDLEKELTEYYLEEEMDNKDVVLKSKCTECNKGDLNLLDLGIKKYMVCSNCNKRFPHK